MDILQNNHIIETVTGISIKQILKDHRPTFQKVHQGQMRQHSINTIEKVLSCGTGALGSMTITCNSCNKHKKIAFTCKSRFCNSCSKVSSDKRLHKLISRWPQGLHYHHFIFTVPQELRDFFKRNRKALKLMPLVATNAVTYFLQKKYKCTPGIVTVIHTFGAKLNRNTHVHMMLTAGGITPYRTFKHIGFIPFLGVLASWKGFLLKHLNDRAKTNLIGERQQSELNFLKKISSLKNKNNDQKSWYIYFSKKADSFQKVLSYIGRYLKRPVIAQSRIKQYDGTNVTFEYVDKYDGETKEITTTAIEFLGLLLQHIPNKNFKMIYYSGIFAHRVKKKYLAIIRSYTGKQECNLKIAKTYRGRMLQFTGIDVGKCSCGGLFKKTCIEIPGYKPKYFDSS